MTTRTKNDLVKDDLLLGRGVLSDEMTMGDGMDAAAAEEEECVI